MNKKHPNGCFYLCLFYDIIPIKEFIMTKTLIALCFLSVYTIMEFVSYVPQIVKIIKTKSADDISLASWASWVISDVCYLIYVLLETPEIGIISVSILSLSLVIVVFVLTLYYQNHKPIKKKGSHHGKRK